MSTSAKASAASHWPLRLFGFGTLVLDEPSALASLAVASLVPVVFEPEFLAEFFPEVVLFVELFFGELVFPFSRVSRFDADDFLPEVLPESVSRANEVFLPTRFL